ncbi:Type 1 glutamine amidotransferase-like domain-containing protein [Yinghuangia soli]|uniref:Peptidase E n=1 Tax=Yinghuangia soli TaxID=2908204 RepID=A0AA41TYG9_9ACTN|nr:Type 1 glutamine amidotransferase-like domain-containing protein [Yinghuangia soli]MCF2527803.1 peptidase E [Yinghuangia soli]
MDGQPAGERAAGVVREVDALGALGFAAEESDLREYFGAEAGVLAEVFGEADLLWLRGGNAFVLRAALALSGADAVLAGLLREDAVAYGGYSAGGCVLAPSLRGLEACDDPAEVGRAYGRPAVWDGLGLLPYAFVPHVDSPGHPESQVLGEVAERYRADGTPYLALRDGQALVVDGELSEVV